MPLEPAHRDAHVTLDDFLGQFERLGWSARSGIINLL